MTMMQEITRTPKRKELLALPVRKWNQETVYDSLYILSSGKKHDSGYSLLAIIGLLYEEKRTLAEIAAFCDDLCWSFPMKHPYDRVERDLHSMPLRFDCLWPSGILRAWASSEHYFRGRFKVGISVSSTEVTLVLEPAGEDRTQLARRLAANDGK